MPRDQLLKLIENRLGGRSDLRSEIILELQLAQERLELGPVFPWFLETLKETLVNTSGALDTVALPSDFIVEVKEDLVQYLDSTGSWLTLDKADWGDTKKADLRDYSAPSFYSIVGTDIKLSPAPTEVFTFRVRYYAKQTTLSSDISNGWTTSAPEVLLSQTGVMVAGGIMDDKTKGRFESSLIIAMNEMWAFDEAKKFQAMDLKMQYDTGED